MPLAGSGPSVKTESTPGSEFPRAKGLVNDFAGALSDKETNKLESALGELQRRGKIDFAIAIVESTDGKDIFDYSLAMAKEWKVGSDNGGILLVVATEDTKWRIQIDKKLEKKFNDVEIKGIGDKMIPYFKEQKYYEGLKACVKGLLDELAQRNGFDAINF